MKIFRNRSFGLKDESPSDEEKEEGTPILLEAALMGFPLTKPKSTEHLAMLCPKCLLLYINFLFIKLLYKSNITLEIMLL